MFSVAKIKKDFPILSRKINGKRLVYLDSTASSLKPTPVLEAMSNYYHRCGINIFRGLYRLSQEATQMYEEARETVAEFIGAKDPRELVFVRNATEAINLVAYAWGRVSLGKGDEIISTVMEHHSNLIPWQQLSLETGATLKYLDIDKEGKLPKPSAISNQLSAKTRLLALTYVSNVLGTINPVKEIIKVAKEKNPQMIVLVDGAQAVPHLKVDVIDLGCDFLALSGHKMLGPMGIGVLWGKYSLLEKMLPFQMGGEMIKEVYLEKTIFADPPEKFEAGTPDVGGAIGLGAAVKYLQDFGMKKVRDHERQLSELAISKLSKLEGVTIYGPKNAQERGGVIAFNVTGIHPHDLAQILDGDNICIRSGHHCAMPLHQRLGIGASARASFYIYNDEEDVEALIKGIKRAKKIFHV